MSELKIAASILEKANYLLEMKGLIAKEIGWDTLKTEFLNELLKFAELSPEDAINLHINIAKKFRVDLPCLGDRKA